MIFYCKTCKQILSNVFDLYQHENWGCECAIMSDDECPHREGTFGAVCHAYGEAAFECNEKNCPLLKE